MYEIKRYQCENKPEWDSLISKSKNGTFLFFRDYMDYHSDRFTDLSFLVYRKGKLAGVLPGNVQDNIFFSHQGLTYGGLVQSNKLGTKDVMEIFHLINNELQISGIEKVVYKPVPYIYHRIPAQEDIYALFKMNAIKIGCNISSTVFQKNKIKFVESRKSGVRKSRRANVRIIESERFDLLWPILSNNLENKYGSKPVHSLDEIKYLHQKCTDNIKLFVAIHEDTVVAGTVLYVTDDYVHVQYISANELGKSMGALDLIFEELINRIYCSIPIFDLGSSTEKMGEYLNENLIFQKEGFGGRGVVYEVYEYSI